jgi:hypothetical protein
MVQQGHSATLPLVTDACAQFIQAPVRALDPLWIPCVTNLSERILFVEANNLRHGKTILSIVYLAVFSSGFLRQANARIAIVAIDLSTQSKIFEPPPSNSWRFWQA